MSEYREVRARTTFLELCKTPSLATEVTVTAAERLGVDAAIIFADILLILEPMGIDLEFAQGEGPVIHNPVRTGADVDRLREVDDVNSLHFVLEAIAQTRSALKPGRNISSEYGPRYISWSPMNEGDGPRLRSQVRNPATA